LVTIWELEHLLFRVPAGLDVSSPPAAPPQFVLADVDSDAVYPRAEVEALTDSRQRANDVVEGFLHQIFGHRVVTHVAQADGAHPGVVAAEEGVESGRVAVQVGGDAGHVVETGGEGALSVRASG